jgi:hypothetical protein
VVDRGRGPFSHSAHRKNPLEKEIGFLFVLKPSPTTPLYRNFCPECGARVISDRLESLLGLVFVTLGSLDRPELISPKLEMLTKRRMKWVKPLDLPQFDSMPHWAQATSGAFL